MYCGIEPEVEHQLSDVAVTGDVHVHAIVHYDVMGGNHEQALNGENT